MMGQSGNVPGALMADDVGQALDALTGSLAEARADGDDNGGDAGNDEEGSQKVPLATRARPLIELLQSARDAGDNVMWDQ